MRKLPAVFLLLMAFTCLATAQNSRLQMIRTDYPLRIWTVDETNFQFLGMTNTKLSPDKASRLVNNMERIFLTAPWVDKEQVADQGYRLTAEQFQTMGMSQDGVIPKRGAFSPDFDATTRFRLLLTYQWHFLLLGFAGIGGLIFMAGKQLRQNAAQKLKAEALEAFIRSRDDSDERVPKQYGSYLLAERLGQGGMSIVYRAVPEDTLDPEQSVAIKILQPHLMDEEINVERFRREIVLLSEMAHPNIINVLEYGNDPEMHYAMELVKGQELRELMPLKDSSAKAVVGLLEPVYSALQYAHGRGVVHRDLKPENILMDPVVGAKVMDFGLAKREDLDKITGTGTVLGTALYLAPEQITGEVVAASDQYALGVILYECLSGRAPFEQSEPLQLIMCHLNTAPLPLEETSPEVAAVVLKMLAKTPEERFPNLAEALLELKTQSGLL